MSRRLGAFLRPYAPLVAGTLAVMILRAALIAGVAYLVKPVFDRHIVQRELGVVRWAPALVLAFYVAKAGLEYLQTYWMAIVGDGICRDLRDTLYAHVIDLPLTFFHRTPVPSILSRLLADVTIIQQAAGTSLLGTLKDAFSVLALGTLLFYQNWRLAVLALMVLPLAVYPFVYFGRFRRRRIQVEQERLAEVAAAAHEGLAGNKIVKAFGMAEREKRRFRERNERFFEVRKSLRQLVAASNPIGRARPRARRRGDRRVRRRRSSRRTAMSSASWPRSSSRSRWCTSRSSASPAATSSCRAPLGALQRLTRVLDEEPEPPRDDRPPLRVHAGRDRVSRRRLRLRRTSDPARRELHGRRRRAPSRSSGSPAPASRR